MNRILLLSLVCAISLISGCLSIEKKAPVGKNLPPEKRVVNVEPTQSLPAAAIEKKEDVIAGETKNDLIEKPLAKKVETKTEQEPDLTSLFDPLYKLSIEKVDLNEVSGQKVVIIQKALTAIGYNVGGADGKAGKNTLSGIRRFLEDFELPADPRPTGLLIKQLNAVNDNSSGPSIISVIKAVQNALKTGGFSVGKLGIADAITRQSILDYQLKEGLVVDGRITNQLLKALNVR